MATERLLCGNRLMACLAESKPILEAIMEKEIMLKRVAIEARLESTFLGSRVSGGSKMVIEHHGRLRIDEESGPAERAKRV
jgi:hypothetical protein